MLLPAGGSSPRSASLHEAEGSRGCRPPRGRRRRWCIECCRLFKAGDEDPARGAGIKVEEYAAPPPIDETQYHTPQVGARHNFNKKAAEAVNH